MQGIVYLDACLTGLGAVHCNEIYHWKIPTCLQDCPIVVLEMFNILVAIKIWKNEWYSKSIQIFCDNEAVVTILKSGKTKDELLAKIVRNIHMEAALADIFLYFTHISGELNVIADTLEKLWITRKIRKN